MSTVTKLNDGDIVDKESAEYEDWMLSSALPRTLLLGTAGMKLAGDEFLPKMPLESDTAYQVRLTNSTLLNIFVKTSSFLAGQVFQNPVLFTDAVPADVIQWCKDIDLHNNDINVFAKRVFFNGISKGISHILIDTPKIEPGAVLTKKDAAEQNIRPFFKEIKPEDVIGFLTDEETGQLIQVRIKESVKKRDGLYGYTVVDQIRVLYIGHWELFEYVEKTKTFELIDEGVFPDNLLPLVTFIPGEETSLMTGRTPMMDLAELNLKHWRSSSDQNNILHVARVPILFGKLIDLDVLPNAVSALINSNDENADLRYVEVVGKAIESGALDLKETEAQMSLYGLQQLVPKTTGVTATEKILDATESNSSLGTWAVEFETVLRSAFVMMCAFTNSVTFPDDGLELNKEYTFGVADPAELQVLLKAEDQGVISAPGCFAEFRRRGIFVDSLEWDDVEAEIEAKAQKALDAVSDRMFPSAGTE